MQSVVIFLKHFEVDTKVKVLYVKYTNVKSYFEGADINDNPYHFNESLWFQHDYMFGLIFNIFEKWRGSTPSPKIKLKFIVLGFSDKLRPSVWFAQGIIGFNGMLLLTHTINYQASTENSNSTYHTKDLQVRHG